MNTIFDLWVRDIRANDPVSIRQFENYVMLLRGQPPESCGFSGVCSFQYVVEADGGVWKLEATRNIAGYFEDKLAELIGSGRVVVLR